MPPAALHRPESQDAQAAFEALFDRITPLLPDPQNDGRVFTVSLKREGASEATPYEIKLYCYRDNEGQKRISVCSQSVDPQKRSWRGQEPLQFPFTVAPNTVAGDFLKDKIVSGGFHSHSFTVVEGGERPEILLSGRTDGLNVGFHFDRGTGNRFIQVEEGLHLVEAEVGEDLRSQLVARALDLISDISAQIAPAVQAS